ncbi:hypothetical protein B0H65DRAFT_445081 [Neurospora tetraspora]|uniref:Uncharacterized protein n=1 Tax=Neurospora tetraspora TaxID=94610 RepID=A0AAE0MNZ8_9PEZI|nr:hypothetical protein B0H65DRAFT_445081 [Neurospora tetraspora]
MDVKVATEVAENFPAWEHKLNFLKTSVGKTYQELEVDRDKLERERLARERTRRREEARKAEERHKQIEEEEEKIKKATKEHRRREEEAKQEEAAKKAEEAARGKTFLASQTTVAYLSTHPASGSAHARRMLLISDPVALYPVVFRWYTSHIAQLPAFIAMIDAIAEASRASKQRHHQEILQKEAEERVSLQSQRTLQNKVMQWRFKDKEQLYANHDKEMLNMVNDNGIMKAQVLSPGFQAPPHEPPMDTLPTLSFEDKVLVSNLPKIMKNANPETRAIYWKIIDEMFQSVRNIQAEYVGQDPSESMYPPVSHYTATISHAEHVSTLVMKNTDFTDRTNPPQTDADGDAGQGKKRSRNDNDSMDGDDYLERQSRAPKKARLQQGAIVQQAEFAPQEDFEQPTIVQQAELAQPGHFDHQDMELPMPGFAQKGQFDY